MTSPARTIPAFINPMAGTAGDARKALEAAGGFDARDVDPAELAREVADACAAGHPRVLVSGGDGTIAAAAAAVCDGNRDGTPEIELAILPGGTLNHFARDHGIPTELADAVRVAQSGRAAAVDVGYAGDRLFLNTSSVGAYVTYVRLRERLERYMGYRLASVVAALRLFFVLRPVRVTLEIDGKRREYATPLVFVSVGERETKPPELGSRVEGGARRLHVLVVRERRAARLLAVALAAARRGVREIAKTPDVDSFLVDECRIDMPRRVAFVAVDGEIVSVPTPIEYRIARDALRVVVP